MWLAGLCVIALIGCGHTTRQQHHADPPTTQLEAWFDDLHARGMFDGAVLVSVGDRTLLAKGYGLANHESRVPFTIDTPVDGASLAKTFTADVVFQLVAEGKLELDVPVQRWLPALPYPEITLRHLLSHSSGLPSDYGVFDKLVPADTVRTTELLVGVLADQHVPLAFPPGTKFAYSSFGYDVAALVAARAAETTVPALFDQRVFARLALHSAFVRPGRFADWIGVRTRGYRRDGARIVPFEAFDNEAFAGGSNIYISARDLERWSKAIAAKLTEPGFEFAEVDGHPTGLTLRSWYRDGNACWYLGHLQGFHALVFHDAGTRESIVFVTNHTLEPWLHHLIVRTIREVLRGDRARALRLPELEPRAHLHAVELAGTWQFADGSTIDLEADGDRVFVRPTSGVRYQAFPEGEARFYVPGVDLGIGFRRGRRGDLDAMYVSTQLAERWGRRKRAE